MISIFNTSDKATLSKQIEQYKQEIQRSLEFVKNIEQGNLDVEYEGFDKENDTKNHLAVALVSMRDHMKVIPDYRAPNSIRLAISPLAASYVEVFDGMERIRNYTESGDFKDLDLSGVKVS